MKKIITSICILTAIFALAFASVTAYADDIRTIHLNFSGEQPEDGSAVGDINVTTNDDGYSVRVAGYQNDQTSWDRGDTPKVIVELQTSMNDIEFTCSGSSHFHLSGMGASYRSAKIEDNGTHMELIVTLSRVKGDENLDVTDDLWWNGRTAHWDDVDEADRYEIQLYRDDHRVTTEKTEGTHYNFSSNMDRAGSYYFRVRAIGDDDNKGGYSDWSDDYDVDQKNDDDHSSGHSVTCSSYGPDVARAGWVQDAAGWWYRNADGSYPHNAWLSVSGKWYFFNSKGYMVTGWVNWKGVDYYLGSDGAMYVNRTTPDGFYVNGSGARTGNPSQASAPSTPESPAVIQQTTNHIVEGPNGGPGVS